jgi:hypothetical protein
MAAFELDGVGKDHDRSGALIVVGSKIYTLYDRQMSTSSGKCRRIITPFDCSSFVFPIAQVTLCREKSIFVAESK